MSPPLVFDIVHMLYSQLQAKSDVFHRVEKMVAANAAMRHDMIGVQMLETCKNCGAEIGNLEVPQVHDGHVVCGVCKARLAAPVAQAADPEAIERTLAYQRMQRNAAYIAATPGPQQSPASRAIIGWLAAIGFVAVIVSFFLVRDQYDTERAALVPITRWGGGALMVVSGVWYGLLMQRR
jgi:uncharacterized Zn finger protein (UPF0148 family)